MINARIGVMLKAQGHFFLSITPKRSANCNVITKVELCAETFGPALVQRKNIIRTNTDFSKEAAVAKVLSEHRCNAKLCCPGVAMFSTRLHHPTSRRNIRIACYLPQLRDVPPVPIPQQSSGIALCIVVADACLYKNAGWRNGINQLVGKCRWCKCNRDKEQTHCTQCVADFL